MSQNSIYYDLIQQRHKLKDSIKIDNYSDSHKEVSIKNSSNKLILENPLLTVINRLLEKETSIHEIHTYSTENDLPFIAKEEIARVIDSLYQLGFMENSEETSETKTLVHDFIPLKSLPKGLNETFRKLRTSPSFFEKLNAKTLMLPLAMLLLFIAPWSEKTYGPLIVTDINATDKILIDYYVNHHKIGLLQPNDIIQFRLQSFVHQKLIGKVVRIENSPSEIPYRELKRFGKFYKVKISFDASNFPETILIGMSGYGLVRKGKAMLGPLLFRNVWLNIVDIFKF